MKTNTITNAPQNQEHLFGLKMNDNSMEPRIRFGDTLIVRQQYDAEHGNIVIAMIDSRFVCRKIETYTHGIMLVPLNSDYETKFYRFEDMDQIPVKIIGRVLQSRRYL